MRSGTPPVWSPCQWVNRMWEISSLRSSIRAMMLVVQMGMPYCVERMSHAFLLGEFLG